MDLLIDMSNMGVTTTLSITKMIFLWKNGEKLKVIMKRLEFSEFHHEKIDDFDPDAIIKSAKRTGTISCVMLWLFAQGVMMAGFAGPSTMSFWYYLHDVPIVNMTKYEHLPLKTFIPFKHDTPIKYFLGCAMQFVPLHLHVCVFMGVDSIFMNVINLIGAHMVMLTGAFRVLRKTCLKRITGPALTPDGLYNSDSLEREMMFEMRKCIRHLQMLFLYIKSEAIEEKDIYTRCFRSCQQAENIFQIMTFIQALGSAYMIISSLLLMSTVPIYTDVFLRVVIYLVGVCVQLSLYCWTGNELTLKVNEVSQGLWESDWLETRKPFKVCMIITMAKLQIPLHFTAGKFVPLILSTQISVVKGSYSYYTLLNKTTVKKED
ncbi:hypothetical protein Trydic_g13061 [Trypoxylus dichotomus]